MCKKGISIIAIIGIFTHVGCARDVTPIVRKTPSGYLLFREVKSTEQLAQDKAAFLTHVYAVKNTVNYQLNNLLGLADYVYSINNKILPYRDQVNSPVVFGYFAETERVGLTVKLSADFRNNLPDSVIQAISNQDVDDLEIFFTPQQYDGDGFKPHCWAGNPPAPPFGGTVYESSLMMGIFGSDHMIDGDLKSGVLSKRGVSIHDGTLSPTQPRLTIDPRKLNFAFWSVVIEPKQRRAAATLHWIMEEKKKHEIHRILDTQYPKSSLRTLIQGLNNSKEFQATSMLRKLVELVR